MCSLLARTVTVASFSQNLWDDRVPGCIILNNPLPVMLRRQLKCQGQQDRSALQISLPHSSGHQPTPLGRRGRSLRGDLSTSDGARKGHQGQLCSSPVSETGKAVQAASYNLTQGVNVWPPPSPSVFSLLETPPGGSELEGLFGPRISDFAFSRAFPH